jgi:hypothetical protein
MVPFLLLPTDTFPKSILEAFSVRLALVVLAVWLVPAIPPPHETLTSAASSTATAPHPFLCPAPLLPIPLLIISTNSGLR